MQIGIALFGVEQCVMPLAWLPSRVPSLTPTHLYHPIKYTSYYCTFSIIDILNSLQIVQIGNGTLKSLLLKVFVEAKLSWNLSLLHKVVYIAPYDGKVKIEICNYNKK